MMLTLTTTGPAVLSAFLASSVEFVEAYTIILAVAFVQGWRPALLGAGAGLLLLLALLAIFGPLLALVPLSVLQLAIGVLLLLFGLRWLRKAILRYAGIIALHDEDKVFAAEQTELNATAATGRDWVAGIASFKAVVLEGLEVIFIVLAIGAGPGLLVPAILGAAGALALVALVGIFVHRPLSRVPENTLKFGVGVLLSAFGVFWTGEGLGVQWPEADLIILAFIGIFLLTGVLAARALRTRRLAGATS